MPVWQELREELHPKGLEIVTVALDTAGADAAGQFIDAANATHPSLIDQGHVLDEMFGVVNVPTGIWIDENGRIVRPPEPAFPGKSMFAEMTKNLTLPPEADPYIVRSLAQSRKIRRPDARAYLDALRDWAENGSDSRFALAPDEVIARSHPRTEESARAAAHFELAQHLHRSGHAEDAVAHFREAHRLQPENWTYKRQAWSFVHPLQRANEVYDSDWASEVEASGAENYYPMIDL